MRRRARRSRSSPAAIPACSPWRRRCARRSKPAREAWRALDLAIVPGITAMLAVAARVGAPLGHDFCALSLSDNLKPWELIERRLDAAADGRLRHRALQSDLAGAAVAARRRARAIAPPPAGRDTRRVRPRGRPRRRAGRGDDARRRRSGRRRHGDADHRRLARRRGSSRVPAAPLVYTPRAAAEAST